jgi:acetyltransferase-like isoleucine patch superfamily enzyme
VKKSYLIHPNVVLGNNCIVEDFVEIGKIGKYTKKNYFTKIGDNCVIRRGTIIYAGVVIGKNVQTGTHAIIREQNMIYDNVVIGSATELGLRNKIGKNSTIHSSCFLEDVTIGENVFIAPHVMFTNDPHPKYGEGECYGGAIIKDNVIIGGGVVVLPHIKIGKYAFVGAGSVVTRDVNSSCVVVGNPARKIKEISDITCNRSGTTHKPYEKNSLR